MDAVRVGPDWAEFARLAPSGLMRLGGDYAVQVANPYALELLGRSEAELLGGLKVFDLLTVAGRIFLQTRMLPELALAGRLEEVALDLLRPGGARVPVLLNAVQSAGPDGSPVIHLAVTRAAAKRAYEAEVPKARAEAEQAYRVKADFLANVSHEIRTPLNGMIGVAGALERTGLSDDQREMVALIQSSGVMLERLLSDILEISKVEAGGLELELRPFELMAELRGVLDLARIRANEKGLEFHTRFGPGTDARFEGDAVRLKQILGNLTANAVKFTEAGQVNVEVDVCEGADGARTLVLGVADTGIGFDETTGDTLFQRFKQAETGITRRYGGTGLGLAISKALVDLMGGVISARSRPGAGSRFEARIPLQACADAPAADSGHARASEPDRPLRILLVEDHPTNRRVVELILSPYGVDLVMAENGALGLEAWGAGRFDLILMDMQMPVMDGLAATRAIRDVERAEPARGRTPLAILSANAMEHHRQESLAAGADLHIAKPVTPATLLAGIQAALDTVAADAA